MRPYFQTCLANGFSGAQLVSTFLPAREKAVTNNWRMSINMHELSEAIRSLGKFRQQYHRESSVAVDSPEGQLLTALLLAATHRQRAFDTQAVVRFLHQYQPQHPGVTLSLVEAEQQQWLRYVLGQAVIPQAVSSFSRGRQDAPRPEHEALIAFLQALEIEIGRYDTLIIRIKKARSIAGRLLGTAGSSALLRLQTKGLLRVETGNPVYFEFHEITTDLAAPMAAKLWQYVCADTRLTESARLRVWLRKAEFVQGTLGAPRYLSPELTACLVAAATNELLAEPSVQGWESERDRFWGDNRLYGALLYPAALLNGWKTVPADKPLGEQLLWASRQHYELNGDDSREPLQNLVSLVVAHDAWEPSTTTYPTILRLLQGLVTRPYLLLSMAQAFHYQGADRLAWLSGGQEGFSELGVLWFLQYENRKNHNVAAPLITGYQRMTTDLRQQVFAFSLISWVSAQLPGYPQWIGGISYYLHEHYVRSFNRGVTDGVLLTHRQREIQWITALEQAFYPYPDYFEQAALPIVAELQLRDDVAADRFTNSHLPFSLPVLRGCLLLLRIGHRLAPQRAVETSFGATLAAGFIRAYSAGLGTTAATRVLAERPYLTEQAGTLDQPWEELLQTATTGQVRQWGRGIHPVDATAYDLTNGYDPILRLDISRLRTHTAILAQTMLNAGADETIPAGNRAELQAALLTYLKTYVLAPLPGTIARLTDLDYEAASFGYAYPLAALCARAISQLDSPTRRSFLLEVTEATTPALLIFLAHLAQALPEDEQPPIRNLFTADLIEAALADPAGGLPTFRHLLQALAFDAGLQVYAQLVLDKADELLAGASERRQKEWQLETLRPRLAIAYLTADATKMAAAEQLTLNQPGYSYRQETGLALRFYQALFVLKSDPEIAQQEFDQLVRDKPEENSYALNRLAAHIHWAEQQEVVADQQQQLRQALTDWDAYVTEHPQAQNERIALLNTLYVLAHLRDTSRFYALWPQAAPYHQEPDFVALHQLAKGDILGTEVQVETVTQAALAAPGQAATEWLSQVRGLPVADRLRVLRQLPADGSPVGLLLAQETLDAMHQLLQHARAVATAFENDINAALGLLLTARLAQVGIHALPQSQGGVSRNRKQEAMRDLTFHDGIKGGRLEEFGILEALWLDSWESENVRLHIDGLAEYDPYQRSFYILVIYFRGKSFSGFLHQLPTHLPKLKWQNFALKGDPEVLDKGNEHLPDEVYYLSRQRLQRLSSGHLLDLYLVAIHMPPPP